MEMSNFGTLPVPDRTSFQQKILPQRENLQNLRCIRSIPAKAST